MNNELNKKLAEWRWPEARVYIPRAGGEIRVVVAGQTTQHDLFTESLDACFKGLVPKLTFLYLDAVPTSHINSPLYTWAISQDKVQYGQKPNLALGEAKTPALALCLAIEKLIDKEAKRG